MDKAPLTRMTAETTYIRWFSFLMLKKLSEILQLSITQEVTKPYDEEILQESLIFPPAYLSHVGLTLLGSWKFVKISEINEFPKVKYLEFQNRKHFDLLNYPLML